LRAFYHQSAEIFQVTIPIGAATSIENGAFIPSRISIPVNSTVMLTNNDISPHTATASNENDSSQLFDSGFLSPGQTFKFTFNKTGNYYYQCALHPFMRGNVLVGISNSDTLETYTSELSNANVIRGNRLYKRVDVEQKRTFIIQPKEHMILLMF